MSLSVRLCGVRREIEFHLHRARASARAADGGGAGGGKGAEGMCRMKQFSFSQVSFLPPPQLHMLPLPPRLDLFHQVSVVVRPATLPGLGMSLPFLRPLLQLPERLRRHFQYKIHHFYYKIHHFYYRIRHSSSTEVYKTNHFLVQNSSFSSNKSIISSRKSHLLIEHLLAICIQIIISNAKSIIVYYKIHHV